MKLRNKNSLVDCVGTVTVLTNDRVVLQGQIKHNRHCNDDFPSQFNVNLENQNEFIVLVLNCDAAIIRDNAELRVIDPPLYQAGNTVRINVSQIVAIGPSSGCADDEEEE